MFVIKVGNFHMNMYSFVYIFPLVMQQAILFKIQIKENTFNTKQYLDFMSQKMLKTMFNHTLIKEINMSTSITKILVHFKQCSPCIPP